MTGIARSSVDELVGAVQRLQETFWQAANTFDPFIRGATRGERARAAVLVPARSDAAAALRLLRDVGDPPALDGVRDAVLAANAVLWQPKAPTVRVAGDIAHAVRGQLGGLDAWALVHDMDHASRAAAVERMHAMPAEALTAEDWRMLVGIAADDVDQVLTDGLPQTLGRLSFSREVFRAVDGATGSLGARSEARHFVPREFHDVWRASRLDLDTRVRRIDELLSREAASLEPGEWRELTALLRAGGHGIVDHEWFGAVSAVEGARTAMLVGPSALLVLAPTTETASQAALTAARDELLGNGGIGGLAQRIVDLDQLDTVGIVGEQAADVRLRHLVATNPRSARRWMDDVRASLDRMPLDGELDLLRSRAYEILGDNDRRLLGLTVPGRRSGWQDHPDYAELGRVREIHALLMKLTPAEVASTTPAGRPLVTW